MEIVQAHLEQWMRDYYFSTEIDIGSSGVENYSLADLRSLVGLDMKEIDVVFNDSPSCGSDGLRRAIADQWGDGDPDRVMVTHGSSEIIFLVMHALLNKGDEVIVLDPCYHALHNIVESIGCELKYWPLRFEDGFVPDVEMLKKLITPRTRMLVLNFPHNPTGATLTPEQLREVVKAGEAVGAYLVWDAAFAELTHDADPLPDPSLTYDRCITLGTLSKGYGLAGLRVGWCFARPDLLDRFVHLRDYTTLYLSPLVEVIAQRAIERADNLLQPRLQRARLNLDLLARWIEQHPDDIQWVRPRGGVTSFIRLPRIADIDGFCHRLAREQGAMLVPGSCFRHPGYVRIGFGGPTSELQVGLSRISGLMRAITYETKPLVAQAQFAPIHVVEQLTAPSAP
ncbi:MAG: capreomycidine synthase [Acidobacteriota bacterium]